MNEEEIFEVTYLLGLKITVDNNETRVNQCRNCQQYGHSQTKCSHLKMSEMWSTSLHSWVTKTKETPARCANYSGPHTADYGGCSMHPKKKQKGTDKRKRTRVLERHNPKTLSYLQAAKKNNEKLINQSNYHTSGHKCNTAETKSLRNIDWYNLFTAQQSNLSRLTNT